MTYPTLDLGASVIELLLVSSDLDIMRIVLKPGMNSGFHCHTRERETFLVLGGTVSFQFDGTLLQAAQGELVTLPPLTWHAFQNCSAQDATAVITVNPGGLSQYFVDLHGLIQLAAPGATFRKLAQQYGLEQRKAPAPLAQEAR